MEDKKIIFCAYRDWAVEICNNVSREIKVANFTLFTSQDEFLNEAQKINPDLIFFVGWSWIVPESIVIKFKCVCLHPSKLPKYRGGSPIQHQIINGEEKSAVSLFLMDKFVDKGPLVFQEEISLQGSLGDIFLRITEKGTNGIIKIINNYMSSKTLKEIPQDSKNATHFKRRTPEQSEIKIDDFQKFTAKEICNKVRALSYPYPNAFVVCKDGKKLFITEAKPEE